MHSIAIKDMAGLLTPQAAELLVGAIRKELPDMPIHIHSHDTAGASVATMVAAAKAGADIVDVAIDSMSGLTSQPSMGAVAAALKGTELETSLDLQQLSGLNAYWDSVPRRAPRTQRRGTGRPPLPPPSLTLPPNERYRCAACTCRSSRASSPARRTSTPTRSPAASTPTCCTSRSSSASTSGGPRSKGSTRRPTSSSATFRR